MAKTAAHLDFKSAFKMEPDPKNALVFKITPLKGVSASDAVRTMRRITLAEQLVTTMAVGGRIKILAEGDSWINILWPESSALGYEMTFVNALAKDTAKYDTLNIGFPGDTFAEITKIRPNTNNRSRGDKGSFSYFQVAATTFLAAGAWPSTSSAFRKAEAPVIRVTTSRIANSNKSWTGSKPDTDRW